MEFKIYKINENAPDAFYATEDAACFDISAFIEFQTSIKAYNKSNGQIDFSGSQDEKGSFIDLPSEWRALIPTGLIFDIPKNHSIRIYPRSGLSTKKGLNLINCVGIVDADYVEQVYIPVYNNSQEKIRIYNGDRIAQAELVMNYRAIINYTTERPKQKTNRNGGFGSTGTK
jgi:dUTP pyrophosphatase